MLEKKAEFKCKKCGQLTTVHYNNQTEDYVKEQVEHGICPMCLEEEVCNPNNYDFYNGRELP
jgi:uncharacterized protein CbrC (UPF0167 family)